MTWQPRQNPPARPGTSATTQRSRGGVRQRNLRYEAVLDAEVGRLVHEMRLRRARDRPLEHPSADPAIAPEL